MFCNRASFLSSPHSDWEVRLYSLGTTTLSGPDELRLIRRAVDGDAVGAGEVLRRHRARLKRMVEARLDRRVRGRVDASAVLGEGLADAVVRTRKWRTATIDVWDTATGVRI